MEAEQIEKEQSNLSAWIKNYLSTGNEYFLGKVYEKYKQQLFIHCFQILKNQEDAKDIATDAFLKAFENIHTFDPNKPFYPWLKRIATNLCIDKLRRRRLVQFQTLDHEMKQNGALQPDKRIETKETLERMRKAIKKLSLPQKRCFCLFYIHHKSYQEIAEFTGYSYQQVRSYIQNGRRKFRLEMNQ